MTETGESDNARSGWEKRDAVIADIGRFSRSTISRLVVGEYMACVVRIKVRIATGHHKQVIVKNGMRSLHGRGDEDDADT